MRTVLLFFDTLRRDALSPYAEQTRASRQAAHEAAIAAGYRPPPHLVEPHTPNFQRLADRCRTHDLHYAGSMPCMPARRELHTGRYNFLHSSWGPLEPFDVSMPRLLHDAGVHSHLISDHYHYWEGGGATYHTRYSTWDNVRGQEGDPWIARPGAQVAAPALGCPHRFMTDQDSINRRWMLANGYHPQRETFTRGLQFLDANHEADDWFLQIETFDPHEPFFADETSDDPTVREYDGPRFDWPAYGPVSETPEQVAHAQGRYRNLVAMCDRQLGRVLDTFDRLGLWDTTALIVTTDHGFLLGEHREWGKIVQPLFEEVIHIPLFMHVPAGHPWCDRTR
jgi:arylsulfatase A-like enzyme